MFVERCFDILQIDLYLVFFYLFLNKPVFNFIFLINLINLILYITEVFKLLFLGASLSWSRELCGI